MHQAFRACCYERRGTGVPRLLQTLYLEGFGRFITIAPTGRSAARARPSGSGHLSQTAQSIEDGTRLINDTQMFARTAWVLERDVLFMIDEQDHPLFDGLRHLLRDRDRSRSSLYRPSSDKAPEVCKGILGRTLSLLSRRSSRSPPRSRSRASRTFVRPQASMHHARNNVRSPIIGDGFPWHSATSSMHEDLQHVRPKVMEDNVEIRSASYEEKAVRTRVHDKVRCHPVVGPWPDISMGGEVPDAIQHAIMGPDRRRCGICPSAHPKYELLEVHTVRTYRGAVTTSDTVPESRILCVGPIGQQAFDDRPRGEPFVPVRDRT